MPFPISPSFADLPAALPRAGRGPLCPKAILLAHYEMAERSAIAALLGSHGHAISCCENGRQALNLVEAFSFGLIVTGMSMPQMDGLELIRALRQRRPGLPVIAIAKGANRIDHIYLRSARLAGAAGVHGFPLDPRHFLGNVAQILCAPPDVGSRISW